MKTRIFAAGLIGLLATTALSARGAAQTILQPLPTPTAAQAAQADVRQGAYVDVNGARIFYQVAGTGTPILLIHGFPLSGELYKGQLAGLGSQFKVIIPDLRGFGKSTAPNATSSTETYASDMFALMDHLGIKKAIIGGHSMGGQVMLQMYRDAPRRFLGMILIDTNPKAASIVEQAEWPAFGLMAQRQGTPSIVSTITPQMLTGAYRLFDQAGTTTMMDILAEGSVEGVVGGGEALATRPDFSAMLPSVRVPALVIVGLDDPIYSLEVSEMSANAIPNAELLIVPGAEHASIYQRPALANAAIRQWAARLPSR